MTRTTTTQPMRERGAQHTQHAHRAPRATHAPDDRAGFGAQRGILRRAQRPAVAFVTTAVVAAAVIALGFVMRAHPVDAGIVAAFNRDHVGAWGFVADAIYRLFSPVPAVVLVVALALLVWWRSRSVIPALAFGGTIAVTWLPVAAIKILVDRPRPDLSLLTHLPAQVQTDGSFPSGHTAFAVSLSIGIWFLLRDSRWEGVAIVGGVAFTLLVGAAVVSDGLHYPSDALASIVWGLAMAPTARILVADVALSRLAARFAH
ncbi:MULTISPECIES: phosphatase PAP2 family protein [unclassified Leucobacter]|uniref:phosphatase PAP2 family protein n=1 Tax=unclassified Leucobacter TaxID=2621730 RepID=UPI00069B0B00|nr:phosphatase PAP2 family protein [Leucobacter sp. Ag1]